jgi:hypothetical protein
MCNVEKMRRPGQGRYPWRGAERFRRRDAAAEFDLLNRHPLANFLAEARRGRRR